METSLIYYITPAPWTNTPKRKITYVHSVKSPWGQRVKPRIPYIDYDYINKLSDTDASWLKKFSEEYYGASFSSQPLQTNKKDCEHRNNAINRCIHAKTQLFGLVYYFDLRELDYYKTTYDLQIWDITFPEPNNKGRYKVVNKNKPVDYEYIDLLKKQGIV